MDSHVDNELNRARESASLWIEYFKNIGATEPKPASDWEPLHIVFRGDDNEI